MKLSFFSNDCEKAKREILDRNEESKTSSALLSSHLTRCSPCKEYENDQKLLQNALPQWEAPQPSEVFADRTLKKYFATKTTPETISSRPWLNWALPVSLAAAALLWIGLSPIFRNTKNDLGNREFTLQSSAGFGELINPTRDLQFFGSAFPTRSKHLLGLPMRRTPR